MKIIPVLVCLVIGLVFPVNMLALSVKLPGQVSEGIEISNPGCYHEGGEVPITDCAVGYRATFTLKVVGTTPGVIVHFAVYNNESGLIGFGTRPRYTKLNQAGESRPMRLKTDSMLSFFVPSQASRSRPFTVWVRVNDALSGEFLFDDERVFSP